MLPQDKPTAAAIKKLKAEESAVMLSDDTVAQLKAFGYRVKKVDGTYFPYLKGMRNPLSPIICYTANGAWHICQKDFSWRQNKHRVVTQNPILHVVE